MKKSRFINKIVGHRLSFFALAISAMFFVTSCEEDLLLFDTPEGFVQLGTPDARNISENAGEAINTVIQLGQPNPNGQTITVSVVGDDTSRYTIVPPINGNGTIEIPAGETSFVIALTPVDNAASDGDSTVTISLTDSNALPIGIGGEGNLRTQNVITIIDDDCPFDIEDWYGSYSSRQIVGAAAEADGPNVTAEAGPAPNTLLLTNLVGAGRQSVIELDNSDPANPRIIHRSTEFGAVFQTFASTGPLYTFAFADQAGDNTFAVCPKTINLAFYRANTASAFNPLYVVKLTKG